MAICGAFVTFESDRDVKMAQQICIDSKLQIFGMPIKVKRAKEPSNY